MMPAARSVVPCQYIQSGPVVCPSNWREGGGPFGREKRNGLTSRPNTSAGIFSEDDIGNGKRDMGGNEMQVQLP
jgi:hypothetical protein